MLTAQDPALETPVGVVETDSFCEGCGFNLHTQKVWRDERLNIPVCRCPECGRTAAAGVRTTATSGWARRLALVGLMIWIAVGLTFVIASFFMFLGIDIASYETLTTSRMETVDGVDVQQTWKPTSTGNQIGWIRSGDASQTLIPNDEIVYRTSLIPGLGGPDKNNANYYRSEPPLVALVTMGTAFTLGSFADGCVVAACTWFWRRGRAWIWLAVPLLASGLVLSMEFSSQQYNYLGSPRRDGRGLILAIVLIAVACQLVLLGVGLTVGRSIARLVVSVFVPPKSRQLFAFLWHCDGLSMPAMRP